LKLPPNVRFQGSNTPKLISAGALPQTLLGILQCSPNPLAGIKGKGGEEGLGSGGEGTPVFICTFSLEYPMIEVEDF